MIYKMLDTIVRWCECYRDYKISKTIPKPTRKELKKWLNSRESLINNNMPIKQANTNTTIRKGKIWTLIR